MQSRNFPRVSIMALALAMPVLAFAAPPTASDDSRVGAPPVIVARPKAAVPAPVVSAPAVTAPKPLPPKAVTPTPLAAVPVSPPRAVTPPAAVVPPMPRQAMTPPPQRDPRGLSARERADWADANRPGHDRSEFGRPEALRQRSAYRQPSYGYQLPSEWVAPDYYIPDYEQYGLSRPASGFGWSRYYDDAVLTDQWGRVYDWRDDVNWDGDRHYAGDDRDGYRGDRYRGDRDDRAHRDKRGKKYAYKGRWTGSWDGGPVQTYRGEWRGSVRPHWSNEAHWSNDGYRGGYDGGGRGVSYGSGYSQSYGYDAGGTTVTTVVVNTGAPVATTRTVSYDVVSYVPVRKKVARRYKPRPKAVCAC